MGEQTTKKKSEEFGVEKNAFLQNDRGQPRGEIIIYFIEPREKTLPSLKSSSAEYYV